MNQHTQQIVFSKLSEWTVEDWKIIQKLKKKDHFNRAFHNALYLWNITGFYRSIWEQNLERARVKKRNQSAPLYPKLGSYQVDKQQMLCQQSSIEHRRFGTPRRLQLSQISQMLSIQLLFTQQISTSVFSFQKNFLALIKSSLLWGISVSKTLTKFFFDSSQTFNFSIFVSGTQITSACLFGRAPVAQEMFRLKPSSLEHDITAHSS